MFPGLVVGFGFLVCWFFGLAPPPPPKKKNKKKLTLFECISENSHSDAKITYVEITHLQRTPNIHSNLEIITLLSGLLSPI